MKTLIEILSLATDHLEQKQVPNPRRQAEEVISHALKIARLDLYLQHDKPVTNEELQLCRQAVARLASREPAAYITGQVEFLNCIIKVTPDVLIPRPETEILVDQIKAPTGILWDVCCGSGCIGIALKKRFPDLLVVMSDISKEALTVAKKNAELNKVDIIFRQGDLLEPFKGEKADYVVCNPPYVSEKEYEILEPEVKKEPRLALVADEEGTAIYKRLANDLPGYLNSSAKVWFEIGHAQGMVVKNLFTNPCWKKAEYSSDWSGLDRFFSLEFE